jgi:Localisation of periplasmic protein complexes.
MVFVFCPLSWGMAKNYVSDIRFGKHASFDRVVVNLNQKPRYRVFNFKRPKRLVVDIYDSVLPRVHQRKNVRGERIIRIRASQFNNRTVRVVLDLKKGNPQHIFCLPPHGDSPYRLVIDVKSEALPDRNIEPSLSPTKEKEIAVMPDSGKGKSASVMQKETLPLKTFRINGFFWQKVRWIRGKRQATNIDDYFAIRSGWRGNGVPGKVQHILRTGKTANFMPLPPLSRTISGLGTITLLKITTSIFLKGISTGRAGPWR